MSGIEDKFLHRGRLRHPLDAAFRPVLLSYSEAPMSVREVVLYPDPVLLRPTEAVESVDESVRQLVKDLVDTMIAAPGIGLAANQIGDGRRVCVVDLSVGENEDELLVLINPRILTSEDPEVAEEGCLSFPDILVDVNRGFSTVVEALDVDGTSFQLEADGLLARVIQHECEHLDGKTFIDGLSSLKKQFVKRKIRKRIETDDWVSCTTS